jgi:hypothetical protein
MCERAVESRVNACVRNAIGMRITRVKHNLDSRVRFRAFSRGVSRARIIAARRDDAMAQDAHPMRCPLPHVERATEHSVARASPQLCRLRRHRAARAAYLNWRAAFRFAARSALRERHASTGVPLSASR